MRRSDVQRAKHVNKTSCSHTSLPDACVSHRLPFSLGLVLLLLSSALAALEPGPGKHMSLLYTIALALPW